MPGILANLKLGNLSNRNNKIAPMPDNVIIQENTDHRDGIEISNYEY